MPACGAQGCLRSPPRAAEGTRNLAAISKRHLGQGPGLSILSLRPSSCPALSPRPHLLARLHVAAPPCGPPALCCPLVPTPGCGPAAASASCAWAPPAWRPCHWPPSSQGKPGPTGHLPLPSRLWTVASPGAPPSSRITSSSCCRGISSSQRPEVGPGLLVLKRIPASGPSPPHSHPAPPTTLPAPGSRAWAGWGG